MSTRRQSAPQWLIALCVIGATIGVVALALYLLDATPVDPSTLPETTLVIPSLHWVGTGSKGIIAAIAAAAGLPFVASYVKKWWRRRK